MAVYNGQNQNLNTDIGDQALHELYLTPYEGGFTNGLAAATMCSYQIWRDNTPGVPSSAVSSLSSTAPLSAFAAAGQNPQTWALNESHFSCEQPLTLTYVPTTDTYTFRFQQSSSVPNANVTFALDGTAETLANASAVYGTVAGTPTNAGYTEAALTNRQFAAGTLTGGTYHSVTITFNNPGPGNASFRFAYSRANGDIADAAAAATGKKLAIVFLNDSGASTQTPNPSGNPPSISAPASLSAANTALVQAVAAANPNTVVVLNTTNPVLMPWIGNVKSVLEMWFSGEEGGTSTARLLLGLANPSGHLPITFPANATDTIWGYNETVPLYPGDTLGQHPERLNGNGGCAGTGCPAATTTQETEGIYSGYRFSARRASHRCSRSAGGGRTPRSPSPGSSCRRPQTAARTRRGRGSPR
jgi:hypothetical protein